MFLQQYKKALEKADNKHQFLIEEYNKLLEEDTALKQTISDYTEVRTHIQQAALLVQNNLAERLSVLVTKALNIVFEENYSFKIEFSNLKRNTTECYLTLYEDDKKFDDLFDSCGYGVLDVIAFTLRITYLLITSNRRLLIFDEPFKSVSIDRVPFVAEVVKKLSYEFDIQIIIVSNIVPLAPAADTIYHIKKQQGRSTITLKQ
jgi:DNA repair exonuclease SbcCD ATPase subunit